MDARTRRLAEQMTHRPGPQPADPRLLQNAALMGASMLPGAGVAESTQIVPDLQQGNYLDALYKGLALGGDMAYAAGPLVGATVGSAAKLPRALSRAARGPFDDIPKAASKDPLLAALEARRGHNGGPPLDDDVYSLPPGSKPEYLGAAPNRTEFSWARYQPGKLPARAEKALTAMRDPGNPQRVAMLADIQRGIDKYGADSWYNTEELRDWFVKELGETDGPQQWGEFLDLIGATSPGSKVPANVKNASAVRNRLATDPDYAGQLDEVSSLEEAREVARGRLAGYGHKTQGLQEQIVARQRQGAWSGAPEKHPSGVEGRAVPAAASTATQNPKPKGFAWSLKGSEGNMAGDLHFTRYMAMASQDPDFLSTSADIGAATAERLVATNPALKQYISVRDVDGKPQVSFNPAKAAKAGDFTVEEAMAHPAMWAEKPRNNEYGAFEGFMRELGDELGLTAPQVQAALWMGAADRTGVDVTSQGTFMELFRNVADENAKRTGRTRAEVITDFIKNKAVLSLLPIGVGAAVTGGGSEAQAGAVPQEDLDELSARIGAYLKPRQ